MWQRLLETLRGLNIPIISRGSGVIADQYAQKPSTQVTPTPTPTSKPQTWEDIVALAESLNAPIPENRYEEFGQPTPTQVPEVQPTPYPIDKAQQQMTTGLVDYGGEGLPLLDYVPQFAEAMKKYPIFQYNPFLLPELGILESSGGKYVTHPNNPLNWGITIPGNDEVFANMSPQEILDLLISGIGERVAAYEPFRVNRPMTREESDQFGNIYSGGGVGYGRNLYEGMKNFTGY